MQPLYACELYADPEGWHPDPDDLDIPDQDHNSVLSVFALLGLDQNVAHTVTAGKTCMISENERPANMTQPGPKCSVG